MAPILALGSVMAGSMQWAFNPVLGFIGVFFLSITGAVPIAAIAALVRWGLHAKVEPSARQRLVDASITMLAVSAVLGWGIVAFVVSGIGARLGIGLRYDSPFIGLAFAPPVLALSSVIAALVGRGAGRAIVLSGFVLTLLGIVVVVILLIQGHNAPSPSF